MPKDLMTNTQPSKSITLAQILILAGLLATAPLAIDAYLPALPAMATSYGVSIHDVELSLSLFLAGFAVGQLVGGPFSDHIGRRISISVGLGIFLLGTLGIIFSPNIESLWLFRVLQAFGGGLAVVNPNAIIRDLSSGLESARNLSHMAIIMMLAPLLAPMIGTAILQLTDWRGIFVFLFIYCALIGLVIAWRLPETRAVQLERPSALNRYWQVISHRHAMGYVATLSLSYASMFAFITASPLLYIDYFGASTALYPFLFGANVLGLMIFNRVNVRLLRSLQPSWILKLGQYLQLLNCALLFAYVSLSDTPQLAPVVCMMVAFFCCQALIVSNATSSAIEYFPRNSATATALLGASGFMAGALSGTAVGLLGDGTPLPMAAIMLTCSLLSLGLRHFLQRRKAP
ncbi:multidrug effflux MFS transporter [Pseudomaricurvus alcaniphilus]|nr:multidrug effflux MFS transporter [Pseudomaricurvus alcaniphilus]